MPAPKKSRSRTRAWLRALFFIALGFSLPLGIYVVYLDRVVVAQFEGKRFAIPAKVYARPLELFIGQRLTAAQLESELRALNYQSAVTVDAAGKYQRQGEHFTIFIRPFAFWDGPQAAQQVRLSLANERIRSLVSASHNSELPLIRLEPLSIGGIYPNHGEDRVLVRLQQVPPHVIQALLATEDKRFYSHHGIDPKAVLRALTTVVSGDRIQGGSTITQQLVKNFFLTQERTLRRKLKEMVMALLLEIHFTKNDILETYINEVYFGQDKNRAIHGFALASHFYFDRELQHLNVHQSALLVGLLKGPAYYNPRRHPQRATERRNVVLGLMAKEGFLSTDTLPQWQKRGLDISPKPNRGQSLYPAFMDLVLRQLKRDYREADLRSEGLNIFTTLDPNIQQAAENALARRLAELEKSKNFNAGFLNGAVVVANVPDGEVSALVGDRDSDYQGFNRALDASRQVGSLLKPAIYLTALSQPERYHLATSLDDNPFIWREPGIADWQPQNYDKKFHGEVALWKALALSYNVAAARLGTELGVANVMHTVRRLGIQQSLPHYASTLLGTIHLAPIDVAQMYHSIASGGFHTPFRAIREVTDMQGAALNRYELSTEPVVSGTANFLLVHALQEVVHQGTGSALAHYLPNSQVAGKTGTTDDLRDSWFAGFSGDKVAVVWVGNDDNRSIQLSGASGALTVWGDLMRRIPHEDIDMPTPESIRFAGVNRTNGLLAHTQCGDALMLPFDTRSLPEDGRYCGNQPRGKIKRWFRKLLGD